MTVCVPPAPSGNGSALLHELSARLQALAEHGTASCIDLRALPLSPGDMQQLRDTLGTGAVTARLNALGESSANETRYAGIWWVTHRNELGETVAELIEICAVPAILQAPPEDIAMAAGQLAALLAATPVQS